MSSTQQFLQAIEQNTHWNDDVNQAFENALKDTKVVDPIIVSLFQGQKTPNWVIDGIVERLNSNNTLQGAEAFDFWIQQEMSMRGEFNESELRFNYPTSDHALHLMVHGVAMESSIYAYNVITLTDAERYQKQPEILEQVSKRLAALPEPQLLTMMAKIIDDFWPGRMLEHLGKKISLAPFWDHPDIGEPLQELIKQIVDSFPDEENEGDAFEGWAALDFYDAFSKDQQLMMSQWAYEELLRTHSIPGLEQSWGYRTTGNFIPDYEPFFTRIPKAQAAQWIGEINDAAEKAGNPKLPFSVELSLKDKILHNRDQQDDAESKPNPLSL